MKMKVMLDPGAKMPTRAHDGLGRSPGERNGNQFQYSCLGNLLDREAWWATVYAVTKELDTN